MTTQLMGIKININKFNDAIKYAKELMHKNCVSQVVTINPEMIEYSSKDAEVKALINEAEMVVPDGVGVKIALKINGINTERIAGIDLARKLLEETALLNLPVAIIGAKEEIIQKAVENLNNEIPNINIVYFHNGYFENDNLIYEDLKKYSPKLILVAMGFPRQEKFIYNAKDVLNPALMIGIGGSLDVWSGSIKRAPLIYQKLGLEWLYRTILQPERFKRIFPTLPLFIIKSIFYRFKK